MKKLLLLLVILFTMFVSQAAGSDQPVKLDYFLQRARNARLPVENRLAFYDSIKNVSKGPVSFGLLAEQAQLYEGEGKYLEALRIYQDAEQTVSEANRKDRFELMLKTAVAAYHSNRMREAITKIYELEKTDLPDSLSYYKLEGYRLLVFITESVGMYDLANKYLRLAWHEYEKAAPTLPQSERDRLLCRLHFTESEVNLTSKNYKSALSHLREAKNLSPDSLMMADICGSFGRICDAEGDRRAAEEFYKEALSWVDTHPNRAVNVGNYISLLLSEGRVREAEGLMKSNEPLFEAYKGANVDSYIEMLRYSVAKAAGRSEDALRSMERLHMLGDSIKNYQNAVYIKEIVSEFEDRRKDDLNQELRNESKRKTVLIIILIAGLALAGILFGILLWRHKKRTYETRVLETRLNMIGDENSERQREMEENVEACNKEMMAMSVHAKKMQESLDKMAEIAATKSIASDDRIEKIESLLAKMSSQNNVHKMFGIYFSRVNRQFFDRLFRLHPDLTQAEIKLCGYMQIGLSSKEIASLTNRSVRTVDNIKYNLRKKLSISEQTESYIRRISSLSEKEFKEMADSTLGK